MFNSINKFIISVTVLSLAFLAAGFCLLNSYEKERVDESYSSKKLPKKEITAQEIKKAVAESIDHQIQRKKLLDEEEVQIEPLLSEVKEIETSILNKEKNMIKTEPNLPILEAPIINDSPTKETTTVSINSCKGCHGVNFSTKALGKSKIVSSMTEIDIFNSLMDYKNKIKKITPMTSLMTGQVAKYSEEELKLIAKQISNIK
ncbi:hypothetical protein HOK00_07665 [bacterium]|jgi:cytochrome c553|nr:hypothetical protein [bacterium]